MFDFLFDPAWLALATWVGLTATLGGFFVALRQIKKLRSASDAATLAIKNALHLVKERSTLADLGSAGGNIDSIKSSVHNSDFRVATFFTDILRAKLISIQQSLNPDADCPIPDFVIRLHTINQQFRVFGTATPTGGELAAIILALDEISDWIQATLSRVRHNTTAREE